MHSKSTIYQGRISETSRGFKEEDINRLYMSLLQTTIREATTNYSGEHVYGTGNFGWKNLVFCSNLDEGEDNKYYEEWAKGLASCMDCNYGISSTRSFESLSPANGHKMLFVYFSVGWENMLYSYLCFSCKNCFGCVGLQHKQYCIFNKQYSKEEYEKLVPKIIEHMQSNGERWTFFDSSLTPYGYNETIAFEYMPLTKEEALARGYKRQDNNYDPIIPDWATLLTGDQIPTDISIVSDDILNTIFICEDSKRPFRIIKQELDFYRKHKLPLPRKHPDVRHQIRLDQRPWRSFHLKNCDKCKKEMISMFPQDYKWTVYCSSCYQRVLFVESLLFSHLYYTEYTSKEVYENVSQQTNDRIVEWKTCAVSDTWFPIYQSDLNFMIKFLLF